MYNTIITSIVIFVVTTTSLYAEVWFGIDPAWSSTYQIGRISLSGDILTPINLGRGNAPISLAVVPEPMMLFLLGLGGLAIRHGRGPKHE